MATTSRFKDAIDMRDKVTKSNHFPPHLSPTAFRKEKYFLVKTSGYHPNNLLEGEFMWAKTHFWHVLLIDNERYGGKT